MSSLMLSRCVFDATESSPQTYIRILAKISQNRQLECDSCLSHIIRIVGITFATIATDAYNNNNDVYYYSNMLTHRVFEIQQYSCSASLPFSFPPSAAHHSLQRHNRCFHVYIYIKLYET